jgi:hypothetical protein
MLKVELDKENAVAILEPHGALSKDDFDKAAMVIDPYIEQTGKINGIVIYVESFPGWENFAGLSEHIVFIKNHHKKIKRLAFATDTAVINYTKAIAEPFVDAQIKVFPYSEFDRAKAWVASASEK